MNNDALNELIKRKTEERKKEELELAINPLLKYSTSQLKAELKRRKRQGK